MTMDEHTTLAGEFARAFGNDLFAALEPRDLMLYVVDHHDAGWQSWDATPKTDAKSGLPYNLIDTPIADIAATSAASPDFNEAKHAFCGLLSSMHSWGLYNGRYGMSNKVLIDGISPEDRPVARHMLDGEVRRQQRLRDQLVRDPITASWIEEQRLFQSYKQLQFFDTLALYFIRTHVAERRPETFDHVPRNTYLDASIRITIVSAGYYALFPYPFDASPLTLRFSGRYIRRLDPGHQADWGAILSETPISWQELTLVAGEVQ